jgi:hypothetical protein
MVNQINELLGNAADKNSGGDCGCTKGGGGSKRKGLKSRGRTLRPKHNIGGGYSFKKSLSSLWSNTKSGFSRIGNLFKGRVPGSTINIEPVFDSVSSPSNKTGSRSTKRASPKTATKKSYSKTRISLNSKNSLKKR